MAVGRRRDCARALLLDGAGHGRRDTNRSTPSQGEGTGTPVVDTVACMFTSTEDYL